ncbi:hypothetical protein [Bacteriovorax sp. Seq25_V]|uniref:hypothetical protein n=1 Tax=Bacteriovorax sp. Seq25_V TaxID=1201288 RepID=UPI00038A16EC|nr:hypothetical protein [Bacteriovorax sp. Seq25_V]EQC43837.1 hypothetical protein M900_1468 [Bacteriovorax sp. Seq25_V]
MLRKLTIFGLLLATVNSNAYLKGDFSYEKFQRLNNPETKSDFDDWTALNLSYDGSLANSHTYAETDLRFYINNNRQLNYSLPQAYMEWKDRDRRLSVGRQLLNWNENETYWLLDTVNPNQGMYLLSEKKEGLTGLQYDHRFHDNFTVSIFFSYFNVPALNPALTIKDGEVTSSSEWVRLPPKAVPLEDKLVPLYIEINQPDIARDIVLKKSLGIRQAFSWDRNRGELSSYLLYKPENKLRMNAEAYMNEDLEKINVIASPIVNHHMIYGMQYKQRLGQVKFIAGFDINDPNAKLGDDFKILDAGQLKENNKVFESEYFTVKPNYERESYFHTSANINRGSYMLSLNYIKLLTDNERGSDDFFSDTVKWKNTVGARVRYYFDDFFNVMVDLKYDLTRRDNILKAEANYMLFKKASINIGMELIKAPDENSYWAAYRANDAVYSSLKFLF